MLASDVSALVTPKKKKQKLADEVWSAMKAQAAKDPQASVGAVLHKASMKHKLKRRHANRILGLSRKIWKGGLKLKRKRKFTEIMTDEALQSILEPHCHETSIWSATTKAPLRQLSGSKRKTYERLP